MWLTCERRILIVIINCIVDLIEVHVDEIALVILGMCCHLTFHQFLSLFLYGKNIINAQAVTESLEIRKKIDCTSIMARKSICVERNSLYPDHFGNILAMIGEWLKSLPNEHAFCTKVKPGVTILQYKSKQRLSNIKRTKAPIEECECAFVLIQYVLFLSW